MDREYDLGVIYMSDSGSSNTPAQQTNDVGVTAGDIGLGIALGPVANIPQVQGKLRAGSKKMELGFFGQGKGSGQGHTPGMYGHKQRQALREISKANRVDFTTHASVGVWGLAGQDRQGNFSREQKEASIQEIKRAIEFAADVAEGGPVVVHTGEFQRAISEAQWNKDHKFESYPGEEERASYRVVDRRTGGLVSEARKGKAIAKPIWNRYESDNEEVWNKNGGKEYIDRNGNKVSPGDYVDYWGDKVSRAERLPMYDKEKGVFKAKQYKWDDFEHEAKDMTHEAREVWRKWKNGELSEKERQNSIWRRFLDERYGREEDVSIKPEEAYIVATLETNAANARGLSHYYGRSFNDTIETMEKLRKALKFYEKIEETVDEEEKWKLKKQVDQIAAGLVPSDAKMPTEIIKQQLAAAESNFKYSKETAASQWAQAMEAEEQIRNIQSAESYALEESYDAFARAGLSALEKSKMLKKQGKLKKDLFISMENLYPESYGSHPDEIMHILQGSRDRMSTMLKQKGYNESEAQKMAEKSLKVTFDTGHMNMWRKYWKGDPDKTPEQNDKAFDDWMVGTIEKLAKNKMIGHVHLADNYGYQDEHLAPGEGNTPIRRIIKKLKENGYDGEMILEAGADYTTDGGGFHSVMKAWKYLGSPVYGAGSGIPSGSRQWGHVHQGYFGMTQAPYFTVGQYVPSEDWSLWSGVPLE